MPPRPSFGRSLAPGRRLCALAAALVATLAAGPLRADLAGHAGPTAESPWSVTLYGGVLTTESWLDALFDPIGANVVDGGLAVLGVSRRLAVRPLGRWGAAEAGAELLVGRHWGAQDNWEASGAGLVRWRLPRVPATASFSLGLSAASEVPEAERGTQGGAAAVKVYWAIELEAGPLPGSAWSVAARLHHRSTAYGLFGDRGGSNSYLIGLRRRF